MRMSTERGDMSERYDVIVVGLGGMGSAAAYALARRGQRVLGIEQFTPAHSLGSSHGATRIVRKAYFEKPDYVPLLVRAYQLWDELSAAAGSQLFTRCGALMIGPAGQRGGRPERWRRPGAGRCRTRCSTRPACAPGTRSSTLPADQLAVYEADAGFVRPEATVLANLDLAAAAGAELRFDTVVEQLELGPDGVRLVAGGERAARARAVIATGAWAGRLAEPGRYPITGAAPDRALAAAADLGGRLRPGAVPGLHVEPSGGPRRGPAGGVRISAPARRRGRQGRAVPRLAGPRRRPRHRCGGRCRSPSAGPVQQLLAPVAAGPGRRLRGQLRCACTPAPPDDDFLLGVAPGSAGRVVLALGFSGHGFKFVPVVGEIVADLVVDGSTRHDIGFLSPERFAGGDEPSGADRTGQVQGQPAGPAGRRGAGRGLALGPAGGRAGAAADGRRRRRHAGRAGGRAAGRQWVPVPTVDAVGTARPARYLRPATPPPSSSPRSAASPG